MSKTILDHLIETRTALTCSQYYDGASDTDADEDARRIVTEFAGPPCRDFESAYMQKRDGAKKFEEHAGDACIWCKWPRGEHGRAK